MMYPSPVGVILAGGKSSRMGRNKALLPFKGARLIDNMACLLRELTLQVFVSGIIPPFECIDDLTPGLGPIGGIQSAVEFLMQRGVQSALFVPVDMPRLSATLLSPLMAPREVHDARAYVGSPLPLCLFFTDKARQQLKTRSDDRSIHGLLASLNTHQLTPTAEQSRQLQNINTQSEWCAFQESFHHEH